MTNIAEKLMAQLDGLSLRHLRRISSVADSHGIQAYLVGGAIRDAMLGLPVSDIDVAIVGLTPGLAQHVADSLDGEVASSSQFNTFTVAVSVRRIDLAMARRETYARPGALPTVSPGTINEDLARRDFTVNAMAASLSENSFGELSDPFNGGSDLQEGLVRVLHSDSFRDDATRILRAARYAVRLGFTLEAHTMRLLSRDVSYLDTISAVRLGDEFKRVLQEGRAVETLKLLESLGALQAVHPALPLDDSEMSILRRAELSDFADKPALFLSILTYGMTASEKINFVERLRLTSGLAQVVRDTGVAKGRVLDDLSIEVFSRSKIYMRLRSFSEAAILGCALSEGDSTAAQRLMLYLNDLRHINPLLDGNDLIALGATQGPRIGELLYDLLEARLDERIETRQDEIDFIRARL